MHASDIHLNISLNLFEKHLKQPHSGYSHVDCLITTIFFYCQLTFSLSLDQSYLYLYISQEDAKNGFPGGGLLVSFDR